MILGKNFKFQKIEIFSGIAIATPASQLQYPKMLAGIAIATPTGLIQMEQIILSGVNHNINGATNVKWSESQYGWNESHQVLCSLVKPNIAFFSHVQSRRIYWDSLHMNDGAKPEIEGLNHNINGAKCQVVQYFVVQSSQIQSILVLSSLMRYIEQIMKWMEWNMRQME